MNAHIAFFSPSISMPIFMNSLVFFSPFLSWNWHKEYNINKENNQRDIEWDISQKVVFHSYIQNSKSFEDYKMWEMYKMWQMYKIKHSSSQSLITILILITLCPSRSSGTLGWWGSWGAIVCSNLSTLSSMLLSLSTIFSRWPMMHPTTPRDHPRPLTT